MSLKQKFFLYVLSLVLALSSAAPAAASLVTVKGGGEVVFNVLADQDAIALDVKSTSELDVNSVAGDSKGDDSILVKKEGEKIVLNVGDSKMMDVTTWGEDLIEIEERGETKKMNISLDGGNFVLTQSQISATTEFPINVDPKENSISVITPSGSTFLSILPAEAVETALRTRFITKLKEGRIRIEEEETGKLAYSISGEKELNIFNLLDFEVPVTTYISTTTGEVLKVDQPKWLSVAGFLFG